MTPKSEWASTEEALRLLQPPPNAKRLLKATPAKGQQISRSKYARIARDDSLAIGRCNTYLASC